MHPLPYMIHEAIRIVEQAEEQATGELDHLRLKVRYRRWIQVLLEQSTMLPPVIPLRHMRHGPFPSHSKREVTSFEAQMRTCLYVFRLTVRLS